jgi:hypothetical protein
VDPSRSGVASGTLTAFRQTGSVLGVALFGSLLAGLGAAAGLRDRRRAHRRRGPAESDH